MEYNVFGNAADLAHGAADMIESEIDRSGDIAIGLAGGATPAATYRELADRDIDWSHTTTWLTDERWVEATHRDANQAMARSELIDPTGVRFLGPNTDLETPEEAAAAYANDLEVLLRPAARRIALLGIGADGHTASLFPGSDALEAAGDTYVANFVSTLDSWRLTATFGLLATSDIVLFLVAGTAKAAIIAAIAQGAHVPAAGISARENVVWLLDGEAAAGL